MSTGNEIAAWNPTPPALAFSLTPDSYMRPGLSASQLWTIFWAYRKLTAAIAIAIVTLTIFVLTLWPRTYEATATVLVNYEVNDPLNGKEFPIGLLSSYLATQTELMRSPEMLLTVVDKLDLTNDKDFKAGFYGEKAELRDFVQQKLSKTLTIQQGQFGSYLIHVTAAARDADQAARIANTVAETYKEQEFSRSTNPATERAKRYAAQLKQLSAKVNQSQEEFTAFHQQNSIVDNGDGTPAVELAALNELEQQLLGAQRARRVSESKLAGDTASGDEVMASQLVQSIKTQLATQEAKLAEIMTTMGPRHPQVIELNSQIAASRRMLEREVDGYSRNVATSLVTAQQLEQKLQRAVAAQRQKVLETTRLHDQAAKYRLDLQSAQAVYKRALDGYDQVMFASLGNYTNVDIVSKATPPVKASKPRVLAYFVLGLVAALGLGLSLPLAYELANRRMRCRDDFERDNGVPVLVEFDPLPMRSPA